MCYGWGKVTIFCDNKIQSKTRQSSYCSSVALETILRIKRIVNKGPIHNFSFLVYINFFSPYPKQLSLTFFYLRMFYF